MIDLLEARKTPTRRNNIFPKMAVIMKNLSDISIQYIKGVGPARKKLFSRLGVESVEDLLYFFPRRYEDRSRMTPLSEVRIGEFQTVSGKIMAREQRRSWYTKKHVTEIVLSDDKGRIFCVWFNQPYLEKYLRPDTHLVVYGKADLYKNRLQMVAPEYEIIGNEEDEDRQLNVGRIVPIYPLTRGMTQRYLRKVVRNALDRYREDINDLLPVPLRNKHRLANIKRSIEAIHFPVDSDTREEAYRRISFEEFFFFQVSVFKRRLSIVAKPGFPHRINMELITEFSNSFPFPLTSAQKRGINEIARDMQHSAPMLRILHGDVGSGKTLVALFGCVAAFKNGKQAAIMAPTEILANQHDRKIREFIKKGPFKDLRVACLVGSMRKKEKDAILEGLRTHKIDLLIGTHALLSEQVDFADLSFVVIDEQHKFGVKQRALLSTKGNNPDVLVMTATPIPRTLSLTLYGDLDVSVLDEMPPGKGKTVTRLFSSDKDSEVYEIVRQRVKEGQQVYIVYPLVEESDKSDLKAADDMYRHFCKKEFKDFRLGLVHGQMARRESDETMQDFKDKKIDILVATTVLEVGVDVPNAGVMVIEHAERFGLSQLHQLRGRVGRGSQDGLCLLIADAATEEGEARLNAICATSDGFKIAEQDLLIRGPGHYFGRHQHGLNELKFSNPVTQIDILELARAEAQELIHQDPGLREPAHRMIEEVIRNRYPDYLKMVEAG